MSNRSILKKITKNNDPIIGISGNLVLGPTEIDKSNLSESYKDERDGILEFRISNNKKVLLIPPSDISGTVLKQELPPKPFNETFQKIDNEFTNVKQYINEVKEYATNFIKGLDIKQSVDVATTADITHFPDKPEKIDGVAIQNGFRILVKDQSNLVKNGIYEVSGNKLIRSFDFLDGVNHRGKTFVSPGAFTFVEDGRVNKNKGFVLTKNSRNPDKDEFELEVDNLVFHQFTGLDPYSTGHGLSINNTENKISVNLDISFCDVSLNKISYSLDDISKNILINGNLVPVGNNYSLGSPNKKWKDLYLSGNSLFLNNAKVSTNSVQSEDENGNKLRTINLLFTPDINYSSATNEGKNNTSISIARGQFKTITTTDAQGNTITREVPVEESFSMGSLLTLADVDISLNELKDGDKIIYDISNQKFIKGPSEYINLEKQNYYDIQTNQPFKFSANQQPDLKSAVITVDWSYNKIIARKSYPDGVRVFNVNSYGINKKKNLSIPYIDNIQIDISGSVTNDYSGPNSTQKNNKWLSLKTISINENHDYYDSNDKYSFVNNVLETISLPYSQFQLFKTLDSDKNSSVIDNILSQTDEDPATNPNYKFDLRIYGNNDASNNSTEDEKSKRAFIVKDLYFVGAQPPAPVESIGTPSLYNNSNVNIKQSFKIIQTESGDDSSDARVISAKVDYDIIDTKASLYPENNSNHNLYENMKTPKEKNFSFLTNPKENQDTFEIEIKDIFLNNSPQIRYGSQYEFNVSILNNLTSRYSEKKKITTDYTRLNTINSFSDFFEAITFNNSQVPFINFISKNNGIASNSQSPPIRYINIASSNSNNYSFMVDIDGTSLTNHIEITNPIANVNDTRAFGKYVQDKTSLVTIKVNINNVTKQTVEYNGFYHLSNNFGRTITPSTHFDYIRGHSDTISKDYYPSMPFRGLRLQGTLKLSPILNSHIKTLIGPASLDKYTYKVEFIRSNEISRSGNIETKEYELDLCIDELDGDPNIDFNHNNSSQTATINSLVYTMGIPSVSEFKVDVHRKYENINSKFGYLPGNKIISTLGKITSTYAQNSSNGNITISDKDEINIDDNNFGQYERTSEQIKTITNSKYTKISYKQNINRNKTSSDATSIKFEEKVFSLNKTSGKNFSSGIEEQYHFCDYNSYVTSQNSGSYPFSASFTSNLNESKWNSIYQIKNNTELEKLTNKNITDLKNDTGTNNSIVPITDHKKIVEDGTLLYINGKFQNNATQPYPIITDSEYNWDNKRANTANSNSSTNYTQTQITAGLNYDGKKWKWIIFKFTDSDITSINNLDGLNLNNLLQNYFTSSVLEKIKDGDTNNAICFVMTNTDNGIGNVAADFSPTNTWYDKKYSGTKGIEDVLSEAKFGALIKEGTTKWGPFINKASNQDIFVYIGLNNTYHF